MDAKLIDAQLTAIGLCEAALRDLTPGTEDAAQAEVEVKALFGAQQDSEWANHLIGMLLQLFRLSAAVCGEQEARAILSQARTKVYGP